MAASSECGRSTARIAISVAAAGATNRSLQENNGPTEGSKHSRKCPPSRIFSAPKTEQQRPLSATIDLATHSTNTSRRARNLRVDIDADGTVTVEDDGPGISVAPSRHGRPALEVVFTELHHGATWDGHTPHVHVSPSLHGVGVAVVAALSERLEVESRRDGALWRAVFERGYVIQPVSRCGAAARSGTRVRFRPDRTVFSGAGLALDRIERRLRELAWLNPLLAIRFQGSLLPGSGGLAAWVRAEGSGGLVADTVISTVATIDGAYVDLAFGWSPNLPERIASCH